MSTEPTIRILHIEKDRRIRAALSRRLQNRGFRIFPAPDGTAGLSVFRENSCEMVLCDFGLMQADGFGPLTQIRLSDADIPIFLLTPHWSLQAQLKALRHGAVCYVSKPLETEPLASALRLAWANYASRRTSREQALRQRLLLENVPDIVYSLNASAELMSVNSAAEAVLGYTPAELIGRPVFSLIHPEDLAQVRRSFEEALAAGEDDVRTLEFRMVSKSGETKYFEVSRRLDFKQGRLERNDGIARDVTRRKLLEKELGEKARQAHEQLRAIVEASPTPTIVSRFGDGKILFANEQLAKLIGTTAGELVGRKSPDFYYQPEERAPLLERLRRDRLLRNHELRLKRIDGTPFWALLSIVATELSGEQVLVAGISDISELKSAQEALQRERNFVSAVLDTEGALVAVLDTSGRIVRFNRACEQTTGFTCAEIRKRPFWDVFLLPEETERIRGVFEELRAGNFPNYAENYWRTRDGSLRLISWSNTAILGADGKVEHIIATGIDITDQRRAEEDLRRAYDQLDHRVRERTMELASINDLLRKSQRRLRKQNEVLARLAKRRIPAEDPGAGLKDLTEAAAETLELERAGVWLYNESVSRIVCRDLFERSAQRHSEGFELAAVDYPSYFKALGEQRAIAADDARSDPRTREFTESYLVPKGITSMLDAPIWFGGQTAGVFCGEHVGDARHWTIEEQQFMASLADYASLAIEAQHRHKAEIELQQAHAQLERRVEERTAQLRAAQTQLVQSEKMAALGMLVAGIAHEINTPVGAIHSTHDTLQRAVEKLKSELDRIPQADGPGAATIAAIMKIIEDANQVIASGTGRVTDIVRRLRSFARLDEAELKRADIHEGLEDTLALIHHELKYGITVKRNYGNLAPFACYPGRLNQVFLNILINARQAIDTHGEISITTYRKGNQAFIEIADNGSGIPAENLSRVFDPGFTTKGVGVGTGLGLSICYQIVRDHKGEINVDSEVGKGTTFTIILPMDLNEITTP